MVVLLNSGLILNTKDFAMHLGKAENYEALGYLEFFTNLSLSTVLDFLDGKCLQNRFLPLLKNEFPSDDLMISVFHNEFSPAFRPELVMFKDSISVIFGMKS